MNSCTRYFLTVLFVLAGVCSGRLHAQAGVSSLSVGASRAGIHLNFDDIRVEEFVNYHRHQLPLPRYNERIRLDMQIARLSSGRNLLQLGLATHRDIQPSTMTPLNLVLVIDRSGSMSGDHMSNVKRALLTFVEKLRAKDFVTIVSYNHEARVDLKATHKTDSTAIANAIDRLSAQGSTNLHAGLMLGYKQARKHFDPHRANRVILLTDGIANTGTIDPEVIARQSKKFNDEGIELSTIGLGNNFNKSLLRQLADAGRGAIHFVSDAKDIQKTFVDELDSLLSPAARKVVVEIDFGNENQVARIWGYEPNKKEGVYRFKMDNMSHGATQVILVELAEGALKPITVKLKYFDCVKSKKVVQTNSVSRESIQSIQRMPSPLKNYSIAKLAGAYKLTAKLCAEEQYKKAVKKLKKAVSFARSHYDLNSDADVERMIEIIQNRMEVINKHKDLVALSERRSRK